MCIGNFWITIERLQLATFSSTLYNDDWRLVVLAREGESTSWLPRSIDELWSHMKTPLMPFTTSAWLWIMATVLYMSVALHFVERASHYIEPADGVRRARVQPSIPCRGVRCRPRDIASPVRMFCRFRWLSRAKKTMQTTRLRTTHSCNDLSSRATTRKTKPASST